jgi:DNA-3-methyladenine glycosylase II
MINCATRADIALAVRYLKKNDNVMAGIINKCGGLTLSSSRDYFASLASAIVYQQLSGKAAKTIWDRLVAESGGRLTPVTTMRLTNAQFGRAGISKQKMSYLRDLSDKFTSGAIDTTKILKKDDEQIIDLLTTVHGIGRWTAEMFLIFTLKRMNVLPVDDLGIKKAIMVNYNLRKMPSPERIRKIAANWGCYRTVAVLYLWKSLAVKG